MKKENYIPRIIDTSAKQLSKDIRNLQYKFVLNGMDIIHKYEKQLHLK